MFCWNCGTQLPEFAKFCSSCGSARHGPSARRAASETGQVMQAAVNQGIAAIDRALAEAEPRIRRAASKVGPAVDEMVKNTRPVAEKAVRKTKEAANRAAKTAGPAVARGADAVERTARRVKNRAQRK